MAARLTQTTLDIDAGIVTMFISLPVQSDNVPITCHVATAALHARAAADGRADWNTADCAAEASAIVGVAVTL